MTLIHAFNFLCCHSFPIEIKILSIFWVLQENGDYNSKQQWRSNGRAFSSTGSGTFTVYYTYKMHKSKTFETFSLCDLILKCWGKNLKLREMAPQTLSGKNELINGKRGKRREVYWLKENKQKTKTTNPMKKNTCNKKK